MNFSDRAVRSSLPSRPKVDWTKSLLVTPSWSVMRILWESSIRMPTKFRCGTTEVSISVGRKRMKTRIATNPSLSPAITALSLRRLSPLAAPYVKRAGTAITATPPRTNKAGQGEENVNSPSWKRSSLYLKRNSKIVSISVCSGPSMTHRIDDKINAHLISVLGVFERVVGVVRPLPGVAQVGVEVDDDHEPTVLVVDPPDDRKTPGSAFPGPTAAASVAYVRHLDNLVDLVEGRENLMVERQVYDLVPRQNLSDLVLEIRPLPGVPEVVDDQNPPASR